MCPGIPLDKAFNILVISQACLQFLVPFAACGCVYTCSCACRCTRVLCQCFTLEAFNSFCNWPDQLRGRISNGCFCMLRKCKSYLLFLLLPAECGFFFSCMMKMNLLDKMGSPHLTYAWVSLNSCMQQQLFASCWLYRNRSIDGWTFSSISEKLFSLS